MDRLTVETLDKVIQRNKIDRDLLVDRWVDINVLQDIVKQNSTLTQVTSLEDFASVVKSNQVIFTSKSFTSVSVIPDKNVFRDKCVKLEIEINSGKNTYLTDNLDESELLLPRNTIFTIKDIRMTDGIIILRMEAK